MILALSNKHRRKIFHTTFIQCFAECFEHFECILLTLRLRENIFLPFTKSIVNVSGFQGQRIWFQIHWDEILHHTEKAIFRKIWKTNTLILHMRLTENSQYWIMFETLNNTVEKTSISHVNKFCRSRVRIAQRTHLVLNWICFFKRTHLQFNWICFFKRNHLQFNWICFFKRNHLQIQLNSVF